MEEEYEIKMKFVIELVNDEIKHEFKMLLKEAYEGDIDALCLLSERIYAGRLCNHLIFKEDTSFDIRKNYILYINTKIFNKNFSNRGYYIRHYNYIEWLIEHNIIDINKDQLFYAPS